MSATLARGATAVWRFHLKPLFGSGGGSPAHSLPPTNPESENNLFNPNSCSRCFWCCSYRKLLLKSLRKTSELELDFLWMVGRF